MLVSISESSSEINFYLDQISVISVQWFIPLHVFQYTHTQQSRWAKSNQLKELYKVYVSASNVTRIRQRIFRSNSCHILHTWLDRDNSSEHLANVCKHLFLLPSSISLTAKCRSAVVIKWQKGRNYQQSRIRACAVAFQIFLLKSLNGKYFIDPELFIVCRLDGVIRI